MTNAAIPISRYRVPHAGANSQFGGVKDGFCKAAYHVGIALIVKIEPITPASSQTTMLIISLKISPGFLFIILSLQKYEVSADYKEAHTFGIPHGLTDLASSAYVVSSIMAI